MKVIRNYKAISTALLITLVGLGSAGPARAESPSAEAAVSVLSRYVWRGWELSEDSAVIQPSLTVGYGGLAANLWGNLDTSQWDMDSESFNWNETDFTLSYDNSVGMISYGVGYIYYDLDGLEDTQELYGSIGLDTLLSPTLSVYKDVANIPGWYATLGIGHAIAVNDRTSLDLGAQIGYLDDDADYNELHDGLISAALTYTVNERLTVGPELYYSFALSDEASDLLEADNAKGGETSGEDSFFYGGVSASFAF